MRGYTDFSAAIHDAATYLIENGELVDTSSWQGKTSEQFKTFEVMNYSFSCPIIPVLPVLHKEIKPNLPWAENHFQERVGGLPLNPGEQYKNWPFYKKDEFRTEGEKFTHTYMERFWPKPIYGVRYQYGDLNSVVNLLHKDPFTRQAYFPIWFPEDTGATHGGRVPCSLGYYFLCRSDKLHIFYTIRSCDLLRHFQDDIYLACRLLMWVLEQLTTKDENFWGNILPGNLIMSIYSLHIFESDIPVLTYKLKEGKL